MATLQLKFQTDRLPLTGFFDHAQRDRVVGASSASADGPSPPLLPSVLDVVGLDSIAANVKVDLMTLWHVFDGMTNDQLGRSVTMFSPVVTGVASELDPLPQCYDIQTAWALDSVEDWASSHAVRDKLHNIIMPYDAGYGYVCCFHFWNTDDALLVTLIHAGEDLADIVRELGLTPRSSMHTTHTYTEAPVWTTVKVDTFERLIAVVGALTSPVQTPLTDVISALDMHTHQVNHTTAWPHVAWSAIVRAWNNDAPSGVQHTVFRQNRLALRDGTNLATSPQVGTTSMWHNMLWGCVFSMAVSRQSPAAIVEAVTTVGNTLWAAVACRGVSPTVHLPSHWHLDESYGVLTWPMRRQMATTRFAGLVTSSETHLDVDATIAALDAMTCTTSATTLRVSSALTLSDTGYSSVRRWASADFCNPRDFVVAPIYDEDVTPASKRTRYMAWDDEDPFCSAMTLDAYAGECCAIATLHLRSKVFDPQRTPRTPPRSKEPLHYHFQVEPHAWKRSIPAIVLGTCHVLTACKVSRLKPLMHCVDALACLHTDIQPEGIIVSHELFKKWNKSVEMFEHDVLKPAFAAIANRCNVEVTATDMTTLFATRQHRTSVMSALGLPVIPQSAFQIMDMCFSLPLAIIEFCSKTVEFASLNSSFVSMLGNIRRFLGFKDFESRLMWWLYVLPRTDRPLVYQHMLPYVNARPYDGRQPIDHVQIIPTLPNVSVPQPFPFQRQQRQDLSTRSSDEYWPDSADSVYSWFGKQSRMNNRWFKELSGATTCSKLTDTIFTTMTSLWWLSGVTSRRCAGLRIVNNDTAKEVDILDEISKLPDDRQDAPNLLNNLAANHTAWCMRPFGMVKSNSDDGVIVETSWTTSDSGTPFDVLDSVRVDGELVDSIQADDNLAAAPFLMWIPASAATFTTPGTSQQFAQVRAFLATSVQCVTSDVMHPEAIGIRASVPIGGVGLRMDAANTKKLFSMWEHVLPSPTVLNSTHVSASIKRFFAARVPGVVDKLDTTAAHKKLAHKLDVANGPVHAGTANIFHTLLDDLTDDTRAAVRRELGDDATVDPDRLDAFIRAVSACPTISEHDSTLTDVQACITHWDDVVDTQKDKLEFYAVDKTGATFVTWVIHNRHVLVKYLEASANAVVMKQVKAVLTDSSATDSDKCYALRRLRTQLWTGMPQGATVGDLAFQALFGYPIRKAQWDKALDMSANMVARLEGHAGVERPNVHQFLMGKGKSSVITPLLVIRAVARGGNVVLVLPSQLVQQALDDLTFPLSVMDIVVDEDVAASRTGLHIVTDTALKMWFATDYLEDSHTDSHTGSNIVYLYDEFDSMIDALKSDLNIIRDDAAAFSVAQVLRIADNVIPGLDMKVLGGADILPVPPATGEKGISDNFDAYLAGVVHQMTTMTNGVHYGPDRRPVEGTEHLSLSVLPYARENTPLYGSSFTSPMLTLALTMTVLSACFYRFETPAYQQLLLEALKGSKSLRDAVKASVKAECSEGSLSVISHALSNMRTCGDSITRKRVAHVVDLLSTDVRKALCVAVLCHRCGRVARSTIDMLNVSFVDVITVLPAAYRLGYTGTVNYNFAAYPAEMVVDDPVLLNEAPVQDLDVDAHMRVACTRSNTRCLAARDNGQVLKLLCNEDGEHGGKYDAIIDAAALFAGVGATGIIDRVKASESAFLTTRTTVFMDDDNHKRMMLPGERTSVPYDGTAFKRGTVLYVYTQKHTVGVDFKQGPDLRALMIVTPSMTMTAVAQAAFRMRLLNMGHTVDFVVVGASGADATLGAVGNTLYNRFTDADSRHKHRRVLAANLQSCACFSRVLSGVMHGDAHTSRAAYMRHDMEELYNKPTADITTKFLMDTLWRYSNIKLCGAGHRAEVERLVSDDTVRSCCGDTVDACLKTLLFQDGGTAGVAVDVEVDLEVEVDVEVDVEIDVDRSMEVVAYSSHVLYPPLINPTIDLSKTTINMGKCGQYNLLLWMYGLDNVQVASSQRRDAFGNTDTTTCGCMLAMVDNDRTLMAVFGAGAMRAARTWPLYSPITGKCITPKELDTFSQRPMKHYNVTLPSEVGVFAVTGAHSVMTPGEVTTAVAKARASPGSKQDVLPFASALRPSMGTCCAGMASFPRRQQDGVRMTCKC